MSSDAPLRIGIAGLDHTHVHGLLWNASRRDDLELVGIQEVDAALFEASVERFGLEGVPRYESVEALLVGGEPEAVAAMGSIDRHLAVVEACAPKGVHVVVEKPLAVRSSDAVRMAELAAAHGVRVLTNYETSAYRSLRTAARMVERGELGALRRMVFRHGHKGPIEIGCPPEFVAWLTQPERGGGALIDFGCYGVLLATWLQGGAEPLEVVASASTLKPDKYPGVDDDATIVLRYAEATAVVQASWCWTHDNKEADLHLEGGSLHAGRGERLERRLPDQDRERVAIEPDVFCPVDVWGHLRDVVRGTAEPDPLASLPLNLTVVRVLEEARAQVAARAATAPST